MNEAFKKDCDESEEVTLDKSLIVSASIACLRNGDRTKPGSLNLGPRNGFGPGIPYKFYERIHVYGCCVHVSVKVVGDFHEILKGKV